ncbi:MAG: polyprenyl synthetase family protein [Bacteroidetes bacterium]|uniref:Polyprenyl synthetase family protein n=1 Tax=Candidatus Egerieousia excrementavium TaxID=2840778 RepID=A0A9D9DPJ8_9BACT|nr:polyprenyl synthetase family protein [Candidatus Egerieousia excrementavium]
MYSLDQLQGIIEKGLSSLEFRRDPADLYDPIRYMISIGGKRIRPLACLISYTLFNDNIDKSILHPALAIEIFHGFTLIHDDIMDKASIRRGQPTIHTKWNSNVAILSGDVMSIMAYRLLAECKREKLPEVLNLFSETVQQVCEGQQYDMDFETMPYITMEDYMKMIGLKTAVLLACSAKTGAMIAGASPETCNALYEFCYKIGLAFQIQDDYMDTFSKSAIFGKKIGGDIVNNKKTWLLVQAFKKVPSTERERLDSLLSLTEEQAAQKIEGMRNLYIEYGIKDDAELAIREYYTSAAESLGKISLSESQNELLMQYADRLITRIK